MIKQLLPAYAGFMISAAAHASGGPALLATAPVFAGPNGLSYTCYISNFSGREVSLANPVVTIDTGAAGGEGLLPLTFNSCSKLSAAFGGSCQFEANVPQPPGSAYSCSILALANPAIAEDMRITIVVQGPGGTVISNQPGR